MVEDGYVTVDGTRLHYLQAGSEGSAVVLLHGGIIDAAAVSWGHLIEPLGAECRVYALDFPGYGDSALPDGATTIDRHVEAVSGFLDELGLDSPTLVGLSMGGAVALGLGLRSPDRLQHLLLVDSYGLGRELPNGRLSYFLARVQVFNKIAIALFRRSRRLTRASLGGIVNDPDSLDPKAVDAVYEEVQRPKAGVAFRRFREHEVTRGGYRTHYLDDFEDLQVPTTMLHGVHDEVVPVEWARRAADRIPEASLTELDDCAHWPPRENPEDVLEHVREVAGVD